MFTAKVKVKELEGNILTLKSEKRNLMRSLSLLCAENQMECKVEIEQAPKEVKFKGVA